MADVASAEFRIALRPASPLLPNDGTKPPPHPLVKASKRGRCFAEAEVAVPSIEVDGEVFDSTFEAHAPCAACQFPNPRGRVTRFDATDRRPVDKWTAAPRPTTSPQGQKPQQKRSTHMVHKPVNSECSRQGGDKNLAPEFWRGNNHDVAG